MQSTLVHRIIQAPAHLRHVVRFFWTLDGAGPATAASTLKIFACRFPRLVFHSANGHSAIRLGTDPLPPLFMSGLHAQPRTLQFAGTFVLTGVTFYPLALKMIFGVDAHELVDQFPDLHEFTPCALRERLLNTRSHAERIALLTHFITARLASAPTPRGDVERTVQVLNNPTNDSTIRHLLDYFNVSERQLERQFKAAVGFSPRQFLRITRFEKAADLLIARRYDTLSDVAHAVRYADQSHFIRDFKTFSGFTPLAFCRQDKEHEESSSMFVSE